MHADHLQEPLQSAYKQFYSTEIALPKVQDNILGSVDIRRGVVLLLLDFSATFDTMDHNIFLGTLENTMGIRSHRLEWLASYLQCRQQSVAICGQPSTKHTLTCGVPQGSVLGPLLFTAYTTPLAALLRKHNTFFHVYADDSLLFPKLCVSDAFSVQCAVAKLEGCISSVRGWMRKHMLKLNDEKTEFLIIYRNSVSKVFFPITVGDEPIQSSVCARNLDALFDQAMCPRPTARRCMLYTQKPLLPPPLH